MNRSIESQKLINEKTIQRYIFEQLNYNNQEVLKKFYPPKILNSLGNRKIKIIIPNYPIDIVGSSNGEEKQHIADFRIIYDDNSYHNVEVEWVTSRFNTHKEIVYNQCYKNGQGFLIVLEDDSNENSHVNYIDSSDIKRISAEEFAYWYVFKAKNIVDETISNYVPHYISRTQKVWLVYLPSSGVNGNNSMEDYLKKGCKRGIWAFNFSNKGKQIKNILNICKGDIVIFTWGLKVLNGTHQRQISEKNDWYIRGVDIANIKKGYYCDFNDDTFEMEKWKIERVIEEKQYMHYFNFDKDYLYSSRKMESKKEERKFLYQDNSKGKGNRQNNLKGIIEKLAWSLNNQGVPAELTIEEYNILLLHLGLIH